MAGELRAKLVKENRRVFGPNTTESAGHGGELGVAGEHAPFHISLAKETAMGKAIDKPLEQVGEKLIKTGQFLQRKGTSGMAKSLMTDETTKALGRNVATAKHAAHMSTGRGIAKLGGNLAKGVGVIDTVATGLNIANKLNDNAIEGRQHAWDDAMNGEWEGSKHDMIINSPKRPQDSPIKGKELPTVSGTILNAIEATPAGKAVMKNGIDLAKKYPEYASRPSSTGPSGYGRKNLE